MCVEQARAAGRAALVQDWDGPSGRCGGIDQQDDPLPDQFGAHLVEAALEADGAVLGDAAAVLEAEDRVELVVGRGRAQAAGGQRPLVERGALVVEAAVGSAVVLAFDPGPETAVEGVEAGGGGLVQGRQELGSAGSEKALDFSLVKSFRKRVSPNKREVRMRWSSPIRTIRCAGDRIRSTPG